MEHPWTSKLASELAHGELPGERAHLRAAAYERPRADRARKDPREYKESAVLILLYPDDHGVLHTALIERPSYRGVHAAQIAFPGGKKEEGDPDLKWTALREAEEEVGIVPGNVELLGSLTAISIPPSGYIVTPYVGTLPGPPSFQREVAEVEAILEAPVQSFLGPEAFVKEKVRAGSEGVILTVPAYRWKGSCIWGATAMMISELAMLLEEDQAPPSSF